MTRATARDGLHALMDAHALNAEQERIIYDPSPELDSLVEVSVAMAREPSEKKRAVLLQKQIVMFAKFRRSNASENECHRLGARLQEQLIGHGSPVPFDRTRR